MCGACPVRPQVAVQHRKLETLPAIAVVGQLICTAARTFVMARPSGVSKVINAASINLQRHHQHTAEQDVSGSSGYATATARVRH